MTKLHRRQRQNNPTGKSLLIFRNRVKPGKQKYSAFAVGQISDLTLGVSPKRGAGRDRQVRCGGMRWTLKSRRRTWLRRTAKSCGPDAAVLASSFVGGDIRGATVAKEPFAGESTK